MFGGLFGGGGGGMQNANNMGMMLSLLGQGQATSAIDKGLKNALGAYKTNYYDPYSQFGTQSLGMLSNALGLGGQAGNAAAQNAFQAGPGYQFAMDQGTQAIDRSAAARGMLGSGNQMADLTRFGQGLANQEYGNWLSRLGGGAQMGLSAAGGQTGRQGAIAGLHYGAGRDQANVYQNSMNNMANMLMNNAQTQAQMQAQQGANLFGGLMGGLNLLATPMMGGGLGGTLGGGLLSLFRGR